MKALKIGLTGVLLVWLLAAGFLPAGGALAQSAAPLGGESGVVVELLTQDFEVSDNGGFTAVIDHRERILTPAAARARAIHTLNYFQTHGRGVDSLEVLGAYTQKPDKRTVPIQGLGAEGARIALTRGMPEGKLLFQDVAVGDVLVLRYRIKRSVGVFPGNFEDFLIVPTEAVQSMRVSYSLPNQFNLKADAGGSPNWAAQPVEQRDGRNVYAWRYQGAELGRLEQGAVAAADTQPYLAVSTFADYRAMALAYESLAGMAAGGGAVKVPQIDALAATITAGTDDVERKAVLIAQWVQSNIRYVALPVTVSTATPESPLTVLNQKYGDCKGHVALTAALLEAAGVASTAALVHAGNAFRLQSVATLGAFNHVVNYVPALERFFDTTAKDTSPEFLPTAVMGKTALLTKTGKTLQTPASQLATLGGSTVLTLGGAGGGEVTHRAVFGGAYAQSMRSRWQAVSPLEAEKSMRLLMHKQGWDVTAVRRLTDPKTDSKSSPSDPAPFEVVWAAQLEPTSMKVLPYALPLGTGSLSGIGNAVQELLFEAERTQDFSCLPVNISESLSLTLSEGLPAPALVTPANVNFKSAGYHYTASYEVVAQVVRVTRVLKSSRSTAVCKAAEYADLRAFLLRVGQDLRAQLIVAVPTAAGR